MYSSVELYRSYSEDLQLQTWHNYHEVLLPKAYAIAKETGEDINDVLRQINPDSKEDEWNMLPIEKLVIKIGAKLFCKNLEIAMNISFEDKKYLDTIAMLYCDKKYIGHVTYHEFRARNKHTGETFLSHSGDMKPWLGWLRQRIIINYESIKQFKKLPPYCNMPGKLRLFIIVAGWCEKGECPLYEFKNNSPVLELRINDDKKMRHIIPQSFNKIGRAHV